MPCHCDRRLARRALLVLWLGAGVGSTFSQLSHTVERIRPSIVLVGTYRATDTPRFQFLGSGFVVDGGLRVVTNAHVTLRVDPARADGPVLVVQVQTGGGTWSQRPVKVLEANMQQDLALLQMEGSAAPALSVAASDLVREGDDLAFTGFPVGGLLGFSSVTHRATVSSVTSMALPSPTGQQLRPSTIRSVRTGPIQIFQLDATAYPGNSGGPLFDPESGAVVGVINMVLVKSTREAVLSQPSGISYAIPSRYVIEMLARHP